MDASDRAVDPAVERLAEPRQAGMRAWLTGMIGALAVGGALLGILAGFMPFGFDPSTLFEQPVYLAILLAMSAALGSRLGRRATSGGWWRTATAGLIFGLAWSPIAILVLFLASLVDALGRGVLAVTTIPQDAFYLLYDLAIFSIYGALIFIPLGLIWTLTTRGIARVVGPGRLMGAGGWHASTAGLVLALLLISIAGGVGQTLASAPWSTRCLAFPGGTPIDAAFSPAGDLLAVALRSDAGAAAAGSVVLMDWPSGRTVGGWPAIPDGTVAVAPDGHVYWSSSNFNDQGTGIVSAVPGHAPTLLVGPDSTGLSDLTWTTAGLIGVTTDRQALATISLASSPATLSVQPGSGEIGAFWTSTDGTVIAREPWAGSTIGISTPSGSISVPVRGGALSFALSADRRTLAVAASAGGLRLVDVATGRSRQVMPGSPAFVALSDRGDLAWANVEQFGPAHLCTSTLVRLGG